jgi:predicted NBD/HSP70 family sugar kinase/biotin operon repressor
MTTGYGANPRSASRRGASPDLAGMSRLLTHLASGSASSRADLAQVTGLARSTVSERVDTLLAAGLVLEARNGRSTGGRPPLQLCLNPDAGLIAAVELDACQTRLAIADLTGRPLQRTTLDVEIGAGPDTVLGLARQHLVDLIAQQGRSVRDVRGIGVSVLGPVEHSTSTVVRPPIMPSWDGCHIPSYFRDFAPAPTIADIDTNLTALAEHRLHHPDVDHLLFVRIDTGIGCGIISHGQLHRGAQGAAGDIGHIRLPGNDTPCVCGDTGCLEAVASGAAIARDLAALGHQTCTAHDVTQRALAGEPAVRTAVRVASRHIGDVLAGLVSFYNPAVIVVGGELARLDEGILTGIRGRVYDHALPLATRSLRIETSRLGTDAALVGATLLTRQRILAPENLPDLLLLANRTPR